MGSRPSRGFVDKLRIFDLDDALMVLNLVSPGHCFLYQEFVIDNQKIKKLLRSQELIGVIGSLDGCGVWYLGSDPLGHQLCHSRDDSGLDSRRLPTGHDGQ